MRPLPAHAAEIEVLEALVPAHIEGDQYSDDLGIRHAVGLVAVAFPVTYLKRMLSHRYVEKLAEVVSHIVNYP